MNPTPPDSGSPLATLRQLKEMLDAGTLTPQEFEALKQRLIFGSLASGLPDVGTVADRDASPHTEPVEVPFTPPAAPAPAANRPSEYLDTPGALTPEATPLLTPEPDWLAAPSSSPFAADAEQADAFEASSAEATERRNPLNLLFAIGGLLLFLAVVGYLALGHRTAGPDEHLTSTSQTAADSTAPAPEVGPQAEQLTLPPATAPETVRVAPALPPVTAPALPADSATTSAATVPTATPAPTTTAPKAAAPKATAPKPAATPAPADTTGSRQ